MLVEGVINWVFCAGAKYNCGNEGCKVMKLAQNFWRVSAVYTYIFLCWLDWSEGSE